MSGVSALGVKPSVAATKALHAPLIRPHYSAVLSNFLIMSNRVPQHLHFLTLPRELVLNVVSRLALPELIALSRSCKFANGFSEPVLTYFKNRDQGEAIAPLEWTAVPRPRLDMLAFQYSEAVLRDELRRNPESLFTVVKRSGDKVFHLQERLEKLQALPALLLIADFIDAIIEQRSQKASILLLRGCERALEDSGRVHDWGRAVDAHAHLLRETYQAFHAYRVGNSAEHFSHAVAKQVTHKTMSFLKGLAKAHAEADESKVHTLIGELLRTHLGTYVQGYYLNWNRTEVWNATQDELLATKLVTESQLEEIFDRAAENPRQPQSYLDLCLENSTDSAAAQSGGQSEPELTVRTVDTNSSMQSDGKGFDDDNDNDNGVCILS